MSFSLGINLDSIDAFCTCQPIPGAAKYAPPNWWLCKATNLQQQAAAVDQTVRPFLDPNGYATNFPAMKAAGLALTATPFINNGQHFPESAYTLVFDGKGTVAVFQDGGAAKTVVTQGGGPGVPTTVPGIKTSGNKIYISVTDSEAGPVGGAKIVDGSPNDYVRNIRLYMPGCDRSTTVNPAFAADMQPFSILRWMTSLKTNASPVTTWGERTLPSARTYTGAGGIPVEFCVAACNSLRKHMWLNAPIMADNSWHRNAAQLVHDKLDPSLLVYVEDGNELWNNAGQYFNPAWTWVDKRSKDGGIGHHVQTARLAYDRWMIWQDVFRDRPEQLQRVATGQFDTPYLNVVLTELARLDGGRNPRGPFDLIAVGAYVYPATSGFSASTTAADIVASCAAAVPTLAAPLAQAMSLGKIYSKSVHCYEFGLGLRNQSTTSPWYPAYLDASRDPGMGDVVRSIVDTVANAGLAGGCYFSYAMIPGTYGQWGLTEATGQPGVKMEAVKGWVASQATPVGA